jgi:hypothetical protein
MEDMEPSRSVIQGGFLDQLSEFTGKFDRNFPAAARRVNCGDRKGESAECTNNASSVGQGYIISGNRTLLSATRDLIYLHFHTECNIWKDEFSMDYPPCVNVLENEVINA